jgi:hypothetical protein
VRAGQAYVEISADDGPMMQRLAASQARLRQWVAANNGNGSPLTRGTEASVMAGAQEGGGKGFLSGGFRGTDLFDSGLKFASAIAIAKIGIKDAQMFSRLFRGDMEGARKAAEELPFGLGEVVKELAGPVDGAMTWLIHRWKGVDNPDPENDAASTRANRERGGAVDLRNRYTTAVNDVDKALTKASLSARDYARYEVEGLKLAADQSEELLAKKLRLIDLDEKQKQAAKWNQDRAQAQSSITGAMDQYAKATLTAREFLAYQSRHMNMLSAEAQQWLAWQLGALDIEEKRQRDKKLGDFQTDFTAQIQALQTEAGVLRGVLDGFDVEVAKAAKALADASDTGLISFQDYCEQFDLLKTAMAELKAAREADALQKEGRTLADSLRTPEERARDELERYQKLRDAGVISDKTLQRAQRKTVADAAAAMPDVVKQTTTLGVRGTFNAAEAGRLGAAGGVSDRIASATESTARNTEKIAELTKTLGLNFG